MQLDSINNYRRGWITGFINPAIFKCDIEIAIQRYTKGTKHEKHYHKKVQEINVVTSGKCCFHFCNKDPNREEDYIVLEENDILVIDPMEIVEFIALEDCCLTVIKTHSVKGDKFSVQ